jgi:ATP-dependent DNA helicase DinG
MSAEPAAAAPALGASAPVLVAAAGRALWLDAGGTAAELDHRSAARRASGECPILCHAPATAARLDCARFPARDILELFAFVRPAQFCLPTPAGVALALALPRPKDLAAEARALAAAAKKLLAELKALPPDAALSAARLCASMADSGWPWAPLAAAALPGAQPGGFDVWRRLPEWSETAPRPAPESVRVSETEARERLRSLLGPGAEARPPQSDYAALAAAAFAPRDRVDTPHLVLAEAGTGIGKTLGYIAPASLWTEKSGGTVWLSTYTKNLQRQIDQELDRLYPDPAQKARKVVVRKGRENYLCLLNADEAVAAARPADQVALALVVRWAEASRDGDMTGGDFPAWLVEILGGRRTLALTDRRGE